MHSDTIVQIVKCGNMWDQLEVGRHATSQDLFKRENSEFTCPRLPKHSITTQTLDVVICDSTLTRNLPQKHTKTHQKDSLQGNNQNQNSTRNHVFGCFWTSARVPKIESAAGVANRGTQVAGENGAGAARGHVDNVQRFFIPQVWLNLDN